MTTLDIPIPTRLDRTSNGLQMTPEEFDAVSDWDENFRYELVNGVVIVAPVAGGGERTPNERLGHWLWSYQESHPQGRCLDLTVYEQYVRIENSRRLADRALWIGLGRNPELTLDTPTITVEFVSKTARDRRRDYVEKRAEYIAAGVREYWVIDRYDRTMTVFFPDSSHRVIEESEVYSTPLLPGFELPLGKLLQTADDYGG